MAAAAGIVAAIEVARLGLTLSHYDAKAHLVVARRVVDSLTPGWQQIGAVWLPLPHLLNLLPVQIDACYRTGFSAVVLSVLAGAVSAGACAWLILRATSSPLAAITGTAVLVLNPNVLYLQATPMTEPLLIALMTGSLVVVSQWLQDPTAQRRARAGWLLAAAVLCRYEAWPFTAACLSAATVTLWQQNQSLGSSVRAVFRLAVYPMAAVGVFLLHSRITIGAWFVSSGFFVPENSDLGRPAHALASVWWGLGQLIGYPLLGAAAAGAVLASVAWLRRREHSLLLLWLALPAAGLLPWYAFVNGHPFRIRYMIPLIPAAALFVGLLVGRAGRSRAVLALGVLALIATSGIRTGSTAPMVVEAQWDRQNQQGRLTVTGCLIRDYKHERIMASMASLAHYMQELSGIGLTLSDFLHEGNGDIWLAALRDPARHVGWVLVEEQAEGGDKLALLARENPSVLRKFERVCEGGGVALYRRVAPPSAAGARSGS